MATEKFYRKLNWICAGIMCILLTFSIFTGCGTKAVEAQQTEMEYNGTKVIVFVIDSCEYIQLGSRFSHKGNCKYCAERNKK